VKLADLNLADEPLHRALKQVRARELPWYACFLLLFILTWVPYFIYDSSWLLLLPLMVIPLIYTAEKKHDGQTKALFEALPADSQEELKRREIYAAQMQKKYAMIIIPVMTLCCIGLVYWGQHIMEKYDREADEKLAIRIQQLRDASGRK
jgi:hypothetical protein